MPTWTAAALYALVLCAAVCAEAGESTHQYQDAEAIHLWVNKVGPYHNPQETYLYYSLPFCASKPVDDLEHRYENNDLEVYGG